MENLELWENGNKRIGINKYDSQLMVVVSVNNGNSESIILSVKCKNIRSARMSLTRLMGIFGYSGDYVKVK